MKRYILAIVCSVMAIITYAECTTLTGSSVTVSRWGEHYMPVDGEHMMCWTIELEDGLKQIRYNIDLDQYVGIDQVVIYEITATNTKKVLRTFSGITESGVLFSTSNRFKVEYQGFTGNLTNLYEGFQVYFEKATHEYVSNHDYCILGKLGIGTITPQAKLHVNGGIYGGESFGETMLQSKLGYVIIGTSPNEQQNMQFATDRDQFRFDKPILTQVGVFGSTTNSLQFRTGDSVQVAILEGKVGIGTLNPNYKLDVVGTIRANEIIVNTTGADFVFAEDYQLRPLSEVKAFITENKHLPEIKSAQEMQENGVSINELQTQLLQKIEELTLYLIQQEETIQELRQEVERLKK